MMSGLKKISGLMLDLSGTVHVDDKLLPGVQEAVTLVRNRFELGNRYQSYIFTLIGFCANQ